MCRQNSRCKTSADDDKRSKTNKIAHSEEMGLMKYIQTASWSAHEVVIFEYALELETAREFLLQNGLSQQTFTLFFPG